MKGSLVDWLLSLTPMQSPLYAMYSWLIHTTVYLTITALFIILFKLIFKNRLKAKWHFLIWTVLLIRFIVPVFPSSPVSIFNTVKVDEGVIEQSSYQTIITTPDDETNNQDNDNYTVAQGLQKMLEADRNNDTDSEVQDPMKLAVKQLMARADVVDLCNQISSIVSTELSRIATNTLGKLQQMDPTTANSLTPSIPSVQNLKWADVFKAVSINSDNEIPLNKRGSGVKRLVLISFFRAEVDRRKADPKNFNRGIIYAIEEPETSQHVQMQKMMIDSLRSLSRQSEVQVILTTHSSFVVKQLTYDNIRVIKDNAGRLVIKPSPSILPYPSLNEINFTSFGDASDEYHNELYGQIQEYAMSIDPKCLKEKEFENWLVGQGMLQSKQWKRIWAGVIQPGYNVTLQTYIRNTIHHPENKCNSMYSSVELETSIREMRSFISNGYHI